MSTNTKEIEDIWTKKEDHLPSYLGGKLLPYEELIHTFGNTTVGFLVRPSLNDQETTIAFGREEFKTNKEGDFRSGVIDINGSINTAKILVYNAIKHFDEAQDISMTDMSLYLESKNNDLLWGAEFSSPQNFIDIVEQQQEDVWIKNDERQSSLEPYETLKHTFGSKAVKFGIAFSEGEPETEITLWQESDSNSHKVAFDIKGPVETAENIVGRTIRHFDQHDIPSIPNISEYITSQIMELHQELEIKNSQDLTVQLAKKAGYVQGVCECVAAIGDDNTLGKKLLSEMNVTKDMAKKYANLETYKALEQGIFAPQQKIEQTHSIKR